MRNAAFVIAYLVLAAPLHAQGLKVSASVADLEKAARIDSTDAMAHYNLAIGYWGKKRWDDADASLRRAVDLDKRFALAHLARAYLVFARRPRLWSEMQERRVPIEWRDSLRQADRHYRAAFMANPMVDLRISGAVIPPRSALWEADEELSRLYDFVVGGFEAFRDGDYAAAYLRLNRLAEALRVGKRSAQQRLIAGWVLWYRGLAAAQSGQLSSAIADFEELVERRDYDPVAEHLNYAPAEQIQHMYVLAQLLRQDGKLERARTLLEQVLTLDAGTYMAHVALANVHEQLGDFESALAERERAVATFPEDLTTGIELAITAARHGRNALAEETLRHVVQSDPRNARGWYLLGIVHQSLGRPQEARADLEKFLEVVPSRFKQEIADAQQRLQSLR